MGQFLPRTQHLKTGESITLRHAFPEDAAQLLALLRLTAAEYHYLLLLPHEIRETKAEEEVLIQQTLDAPNNLMLVAVQERQLIGYLGFCQDSKERLAHVGELGMTVLPDWRGKGVGESLLTSLIEWATAHPVIEKLTLGVLNTNASAIALYQKLGFYEEGLRRRHVKMSQNDYRDRIEMSLLLEKSASHVP